MSFKITVRFTVCNPADELVKLLVVFMDVKLLLVLVEPLAKLALPSTTVPVALVVVKLLVVVSNTLSETEPLVVIVTLAREMLALLVTTRVELPPTTV